jgi:hypothetical protein
MKDELSFIQCLQPSNSGTASHRRQKLQLMQDLSDQLGHQLQRQDLVFDADTSRKFTNCTDLFAAIIKFTVILLSPAHDFGETTPLLLVHLTLLLQWWEDFQNTVASLSHANNLAIATQIADVFMSSSGKVYKLGKEIYESLEPNEQPDVISSTKAISTFSKICAKLINQLQKIEDNVAANNIVIPAPLVTYLDPSDLSTTVTPRQTSDTNNPNDKRPTLRPAQQNTQSTKRLAKRPIIKSDFTNKTPQLRTSAQLLFYRARQTAFQALPNPQPCIKFLFGGCTTSTCKNSHKEFSQFNAAEKAAMHTLKNTAPSEYVFSL